MANEHMKNTLKIKYTKMRCHYSLIKISEIDKNQTPVSISVTYFSITDHPKTQ